MKVTVLSGRSRAPLHWVQSLVKPMAAPLYFRRHVILALFSCTCACLYPQSVPTTGSAQPPVFKANATNVVVDVVVSNRQGQPITGLRAEDFEVTENGVSQAINSFTEHTGLEAPPTAQDQTSAPQSGVYSNVQSVAAGDASNVILIDGLNTLPEDQSFLEQQIIQYLKSSAPGRPLAVFALGSKLQLIHGFTRDPSEILAALQNSKGRLSPATTAVSRSPVDDTIAREQVYQGPGGLDAWLLQQSETRSYQAAQRITITVEALEQIGRFLSDVPDRKNLIWFAGYFSLNLPPEASVRGLSPGRAEATDPGSSLRKLTNLLASSRVAIYPVSARPVGIRSSAESVSPATLSGEAEDDQANLNEPSQTQVLKDPRVREGDAPEASQTTASALAKDTGGQAVSATNRPAQALSGLIQRGAKYYTLSYAPTDKAADGSYRNISVKLKNSEAPHYTLAYRRGYFANASNAAQTTGTDPLLPLLKPGLVASTQIPYKLRIQPLDPQSSAGLPRAGGNDKLSGPAARYGIDFQIPLPESDLQAGQTKMKLEVIAFDQDGKPVNWAADMLATGRITTKNIGIRVTIDLPPGKIDLVTGIYDMNSGDAGTLEVPRLQVEVASEGSAVPDANPAPSSSQLKTRSPQEVAQALKAERRIDLNVVVRDYSGKTVSGLSPQDFAVFDNGREQTITSLRNVDGSTAQPPTEVILLLDTVNTSVETVGLERQGMEKFLRSGHGQLPLPVSIIYFTDNGIKLNRASKDGNALAEDLKTLPTSLRVNSVSTGLEGLQQRFRSSTRAIGQITKYEATKPGRKLLIWIGPGWPLLPQGIFKSDSSMKTTFFNNIVDLNTALRQAGITLYSVPLIDLSQGLQVGTFMYQDYLKGVPSPKEADSGNLAVQVLALQTGGIAFPPSGNIAARILDCVDDAKNSYELTFDSAPGNKPDEYHQLNLKLDKPGLTVRTRTEYYAQP